MDCAMSRLFVWHIAGHVCTVMRIAERLSGLNSVNLCHATLTSLSTITSPRCVSPRTDIVRCASCVIFFVLCIEKFLSFVNCFVVPISCE